MLTLLLATGVFTSTGGGAVGDVTTPAERTIKLSRTGAAPTATQQLDPSDKLDFLLDLSALLQGTEEAFAGVTIIVVPASAALGFTILSTAPYQPQEVTNSKIRFWATIDEASRGLADWNRQGVACSFEITATTDSEPPRVYQRTASIKVGQR